MLFVLDKLVYHLFRDNESYGVDVLLGVGGLFFILKIQLLLCVFNGINTCFEALRGIAEKLTTLRSGASLK